MRYQNAGGYGRQTCEELHQGPFLPAPSRLGGRRLRSGERLTAGLWRSCAKNIKPRPMPDPIPDRAGCVPATTAGCSAARSSVTAPGVRRARSRGGRAAGSREHQHDIPLPEDQPFRSSAVPEALRSVKETPSLGRYQVNAKLDWRRTVRSREAAATASRFRRAEAFRCPDHQNQPFAQTIPCVSAEGHAAKFSSHTIRVTRLPAVRRGEPSASFSIPLTQASGQRFV